jgi:UDP-glucose 4-epimerase
MATKDLPDLRGRRIVLTGGTGFLGAHLALELALDNRVTLFDNGRRNALDRVAPTGLTGAVVLRGDIRDLYAVRRAVDGADLVVHLAAIAGVHSYYETGVETMEVNFIGTRTVLAAVREAAPNLQRFVNFSTSEVYGALALNAREDAPTPIGPVGEPRWTYAASKVAAEHLCLACHRQYGLPVVSLRPFNIYGPGQVGEGAVQILVRRAIAGEPLEVTGDGRQVRAWCYVSDLVEAVKRALTVPAAVGGVFNVGNPAAAVSMLDLAERIRRLADSTSQIVFRPHPGADVQVRVPDIARARSVLGFEPAVDLDEGLRRTIAWFRENRV